MPVIRTSGGIPSYVLVDRSILTDDKLSLSARGLFAFISTLSEIGGEIDIDPSAFDTTEFFSALKELADKGYVW